MTDINSEQIMNELRKEIAEKGIDKEPLKFADVNRAEASFHLPTKYNEEMMKRELVNVNGLWDSSLEPGVKSTNPIKKKIKTMVYKMVTAIMNPHLEKQVIFNASVANSMNMMHCLAEENASLKEQVKELTERIEKLEGTAK